VLPPGIRLPIGRLAEDLAHVLEVELDAGLGAIAGRCRPALVEPPVAATTTAAFSRALRVTMSRGRRPR
jgi:hypothetical protein